MSLLLASCFLNTNLSTSYKEKCSILLKRQVTQRFAYYAPEELGHIKSSLLKAYSQNNEASKYIAPIISLIIERGGLSQWPEALFYICNAIAKRDANTEQHINTLYMIVEDSPQDVL